MDCTPDRNDVAPTEVTVVPPTDQKSLEWIAVLSAARFDYRLSVDDRHWIIHLPADQSVAALTEIREYEIAEASVSAAQPPPLPLTFRFSHEIYTTLWAIVFLTGCYILFGPTSRDSVAVQAGAADAERICGGEWWRVVTALTLHSNAAHLGGNLFGLIFLGYVVSRIMGPGLGWFLILASGSIGNAIEAVLVSPYHVSVGASTAVFGALGILVGYRGAQIAVLRQQIRPTWRKTWFPLGAGLSLLAMWGASPGSDMMAHLTGFFVGLALAIPFGIREFEWMKGPVQKVLDWACVAILVGAWGLAGMTK